MVNQSTARRRARLRRSAIGATILAGVTLSIAAYLLVERSAVEHTAAQFERLAVERTLGIERELRGSVEVLRSVRAFYAASKDVEPDEFQAFAGTTIEQFPEIGTLAWAPTREDGHAFAEVTYLEPATTVALRRGFDLGSGARWVRALDAARDSASIAITDAPLPSSGESQLMAVIAIYRNGVRHDSVVERRRALAGFVVAVMREGTLVEEGIRRTSPIAAGIDLRLYDHAPQIGTRLLYTHETRAREVTAVAPPRRSGMRSRPALQHGTRLAVGGRRFAIVATSAPEFFVLHPTSSTVPILLLGLFTTAAAAGYFWERRRAVEAQQGKLLVSAALTRVGRELIGVVDTRVVLSRLSELTVQALECTESHTWVLDRRVDSYGAIAGYGLPAELQDQMSDLRVSQAVLAPVLQHLQGGEVVQLTRQDRDPAVRALLARYGVSAALFVPLRRDSEMIGIQTAGYRDGTTSFMPAQEQIALGVAQLASLALANAHMVEELAQANRLKSEFVSTMSHELRTPLNIIFGYTEFLRDIDFDSDQRTEFIDKIDQQGRQLLELIENTLEIGNVERGVAELRVEQVELRDLWKSIVDDCAPYPRPQELALEWITPPAASIVTDAQKVRTILRNLVTNALKFTEHGIVHVEARLEEDGIVFRVADTGIGIRPEDQGKIFELYRQGDGSDTRRHGGTGVGLYVVRTLVDQLQGRLTVQSRPGDGSVFTVVLPRRFDSPGTSRAA